MPLPPAPRPRIHHGDRHWGTKLKHMQLRESSSHSLQAIIAPSTWLSGGGGVPPAHSQDQTMPRSTHLQRPGLSGSPETGAMLSVLCVEMKERIDATSVENPG